MNRRGFFKALVATAVIAVATSTRLGQTVFDVVKSGYRYILYGDGVTDDTEALQALLDGREVVDIHGEVISGVLSPAKYRVSHTLVFGDHKVMMKGSHFRFTTKDPEIPLFRDAKSRGGSGVLR